MEDQCGKLKNEKDALEEENIKLSEEVENKTQHLQVDLKETREKLQSVENELSTSKKSEEEAITQCQQAEK